MILLTLRTLLARKLRLLMSGLAVVIGVAFLSGVLVFSNGLSTTFDGIVNGSTPDGLVRVQDAAEFSAGEGGVPTQTLSPGVVQRLEALPEVERADGDVEGFGMSLLAADGTLVGGTGAPTLAFNYHDGPNMAGDEMLLLESGRWPQGTDEVVLDEGAAENGDYEVGDTVQLLAPYGSLNRTAELVGTAEFNGGGTAGATLLIFSTEGAQEIFLGGREAFTRVSLTAADGVTQPELAAAAEAVIPDGFESVTGDTYAEEQQEVIGTFLDVIQTFLLIFAAIALIVGAFIILNTFSILVAQRTRELALLRALGASRQQVTRSVMLEAFVLALLASTLGIGVGWVLARGLAALFRAVGLDIAGNALDLTAGAVLTSYAVGIVVTVAAAYFPSRRAGRAAPIEAMRADVAPERRSMRRRVVIGSVLLAVGAAMAAYGLVADSGGALWVGIGGAVWILTLAVISPIVGRPLLVTTRWLFTRLFGTPGRLAGENALRDPRRTGATASALMIGLALVSTIGVIAASFNATIDDAVDEDFAADFLVQSNTFLPFSPAIGDELEEIDGVAVVSRQQWAAGRLDGDTVYVAGNEPSFDGIYELDMLRGTQEVSGAEAVLNEDTAEKYGLGVGDRFTLSFPAGEELDLEVVGIHAGSEVTGGISVPLDQLAEAGIARQDSSISIMLEPGADPGEVGAALDEAATPVPIVGVYDKQEFADSIRGQVNQLLYMIYGLLALAIVIAVFGIVNTLGLSVFERTREIGLLRAVGMSRAKLRRMITLESVTIAVLGAVLGMALGTIVGVLLRATLDDLTSLGLPLAQLGIFLVVAVVVGVLAAIVPAVRASRMNVLDAIATE